MSGTDTKFLPRKESVYCSGSYKKLRRKRHRNKCKNSNLKKKRLKKFRPVNRATYYKSNILKFSSFSEKTMSNWYWSNYKKALEWQNKHKLAYWKACALALFEENLSLIQIINSMQPGMVPKLPVTLQNIDSRVKYNNKNMKSKYPENFINFQTSDQLDDNTNLDENDDDNDSTDNNEELTDIEFEMSEEMMEFFEQSYKHKMDLKKLEEKELLINTEQEIKQIQSNKIKRNTEMNFLYGEGASMITGMETAVQLTFDKYCDTKSPKYWPNIPFKL